MLELLGIDKKTIMMIVRLCKLDLKVKSKESMMGLLWYAFWPIFQSGGYVIIFNLVKQQGNLGDDILRQLLIVLIWTQFSLMIIYSFSLITQNIDIIKNLIFPFYNSITSEILNRFIFFLLTFLPFFVLYFFKLENYSNFFFINLALFLISVILITVSLSWFASIIGMIIPDITGIFMIISTFCIAFSSLFMDLNSFDNNFYNLIFHLNPVNIIADSFDKIYLNSLSISHIKLFCISIIIYIFSLLSIKSLFREIMKII